jgi:hypothetical protein
MIQDTYGHALVLVGAGLNGMVALRALIGLTNPLNAFSGSFQAAEAIMRRNPPSILCIIEEQLEEAQWRTVAQWASDGVSRVLVLVAYAPQASFQALIVAHAATAEMGAHGRAVLAAPNDLIALRAFTKEMFRN